MPENNNPSLNTELVLGTFSESTVHLVIHLTGWTLAVHNNLSVIADVLGSKKCKTCAVAVHRGPI